MAYYRFATAILKSMIRSSRLFLLLGLVLSMARLGAADSMNIKSDILSSCVKVSTALAADDLAAAKTAAATVAEHASMADNKDVAAKANAVAKASLALR